MLSLSDASFVADNRLGRLSETNYMTCLRYSVRRPCMYMLVGRRSCTSLCPLLYGLLGGNLCHVHLRPVRRPCMHACMSKSKSKTSEWASGCLHGCMHRYPLTVLKGLKFSSYYFMILSEIILFSIRIPIYLLLVCSYRPRSLATKV